MALGSTLPLSEMSGRDLPVVKGGRHVKLTTSQPSVVLLSRKCVNFDIPQRYGRPQPRTGLVFLHTACLVQFYFKSCDV
jgi:hypothetical protein